MASKSEFEVVREATVPARPEQVWPWLVDFRRWRPWSPWEEIDPDLKRFYEGEESGVGAVYEWYGNRKAGTGRMEITGADAPRRLEIALQFIKPFKAHSTTTFELAPHDDGTRVTWRMVGPKTFTTRFMGVFMSMERMVGPDFEKGLAQLGETVKTSG
jgi:uncharacterized protein YndB with AHSA1/START domain